MNQGLYVNFGCGLIAPENFLNFDISPTLAIQKIPILGWLAHNLHSVKFPQNIQYGDIVRGLPLKHSSIKGVYCSHVLEHLTYEDFKIAIRNVYKYLQPGGVFRIVVPDLEFYIRNYNQSKLMGEKTAAIDFCSYTLLGIKKKPNSIIDKVRDLFGNSKHLWMWDFDSLQVELESIGFVEVKKCSFNETSDNTFLSVEQSYSFDNGVCVECKKF